MTVVRHRLGSLLVVVEVALAFVLLTGAGVLIRSFVKMWQADMGFDGTNVVAVPTTMAFRFAYGPGSFRRHLGSAIDAGLSVRVRRDPLLALDIDTPTDLTHPLVQEVLPTWLRTNPANLP